MSWRWNQKGVTLPELMIGTGIAIGLGLVGVKLFVDSQKSMTGMATSTDRLTIEKILENHIRTRKGCDAVRGKRVGETFAVRIGTTDYVPGLVVGGATLRSLSLVGFVPLDASGNRGTTNVELGLETSGRTVKSQIPITVSMAAGPNPVILDCHFDSQRAYDEIVARVCSGTYGSLTAGLDCASAMDLVKKEAIKEICKDLYGSRTPQYNGFACDLSKIHANQGCGSGKVTGFDSEGRPTCG